MSMPLLPDDFDSGTAPMKPVYKAGYSANTYGGFPDNPVVTKRKKLAKNQSNSKFLRAKGIQPLPGLANMPPKLRG
jgi:hypothetical protein